MPKKKLNPESLKNLRNTRAPDNPGDVVSVGVRLPISDAEWLRSFPEGIGFHIRAAVKLYREHLNEEQQPDR